MTIERVIDTTDTGEVFETVVISDDSEVILVTKQPDGRITVTDDEGHSLA